MKTVYDKDHINPDKDVALLPPDFLYYPEEPEACFNRKGRRWQSAATIAKVKSGRLFAAYSGGGIDEGPSNYNCMSYSDDDGLTWRNDYLIIDHPEIVRMHEPILWVAPDGTLWHFWAQSYVYWDGRGGVWGSKCIDPDAEMPHWTAPVRLCDGAWLFPVSIWHNYVTRFHSFPELEKSNVYISTDEGKSLQYSIAVTERKIVLAGADGYALSVAVAEFYETAHSGKNLTVPAGFEKRGKVTFAADASYPIAVTEGKQNEVLMYDLAKGGLTDDNVIKRFSVGGSGAADVRLREWQGRQVVLSAGGYHAKLLDWETGDVLWSYEGTLIWNAHAMELLPDGILAVAGSTGNNLTFFSLTDRTATPLRLEFADAHGAMWDPSHTCLWVCGGNQMKAYRVTQSGGRIAAEEIRSLTIPANGAHDLQPVYGTPGTYWLTTSGTVFRFDSNTETFRAVPTSSQLGMKGVKGMGNFTDGCIVQTIADGSDNSWNTATVWLYRYNATLNLYVPTAFVSPTGAALYKVRVWSAAYQ